MESIYDQLFAFFVTIGIGFLAGILFDVYRVFRGLWRPKKLGTFIGDILFWFVMTVIVFILLLVGNWGEIRIYVFIGIALGAYLYVRFFSKKWKIIIRRIFLCIIKILTMLWKIISWPFKVVLKIIVVPAGFILSGLAASLSFIVALIPFKKKQPDDVE